MLLFKKIFEKTNLVKWCRIRIPFSIITKFRYPIRRMQCIYDLKDFRWIKIWFPVIIQYSVVISLYPYDEVWLIVGEFRVTRIF